MDSWVVVPLTVAALGVCWLLAWLALLLVFMWLVRRDADAITLQVFVRLAETWRMPTGPLHMLELAAARRRAENTADVRRARLARRRGRTPPGST